MSRDDSRDRNERRSWKEIDQMRDGRSGGRKSEKKRSGKKPNRHKQKQLDNAFSSLFSDPAGEEALAELRSHFGKETLPDALAHYLKHHDFPEPYDILQVLLEEHPDTEVQFNALEKMDETVDEQADSTQQVFKTRVKLLKMTARDLKLKKLASRIAKRRKY